ncbi:MAG: YbaK/EbsC family protein [Candidatus Promineofilum sp.]|nr:YbaK/EbsC family protein [Promineifilum sp.]
MSAEPQTPVGRALAAAGVAVREFRHAGPVTSLAQAAEERGQRPSQVVRSILFRLAADEYAMVLVAGPQQVDWKALRRHLGQSRLTMATADEVRDVTGYEIGAVSPFGLPRPVRVLLDGSVLGEDEVSIGSGERGTTVILGTAELLRALGEVERVSVT